MPAMLWHALAFLALCNGQLTTEEEIQVLSDADQQLFQKVQETRRFINGQLIEVIEVLSEKVDENRREIGNLAEMTQKSLKQIRQKVNQYSQQLGEAEDLAEVELPLIGAAVAQGEASQAHKIEQLAHLTKLLQMQQQMDVKMEKMLNRSHHRVNEEIAQLKDKVSQVNKTNQRLQQKLLQNERGNTSSVPNDRSVAKETQAFQRDAAKKNQDEDKKIDNLHTRFGQFIADTDTKMNQLEAQLHKGEINEARINSLDERMFEVRSSLVAEMNSMSQLQSNVAAEMHSRDKWIFIQEVLLCICMGIAFMAAHPMLLRLPHFRPSLQEPLLGTDTPSSEHSFSVISAQAVPLPQLFLKRTAMSLAEGPPVAAEDLRPNCSVRAATGGWLEVEAVTFKHVPQCDVIQLTLEGDAPNLCITARQRVARASKEKEVIPAMELREGDSILYHGSCLEVKTFDRQTLHNVELVEVLFNADGAVETLADAETESAFHIV